MQRVYLDHNATTPVHPAVVDAMARLLREDFGNPSSVHHFGQRAKAAVDQARSAVATLIGADPAEVVFTSGGTESDNFAIRGVAEALDPARRRRTSDRNRDRARSRAEHAQGASPARLVDTLLPVGPVESHRLTRWPDVLTDDTALVSVMHANNEIGTIQPVAEHGAAGARARGALFHTDAVQSAGKIRVNVKALDVDLLSISAHKFYGPKGIGALWIRRGSGCCPY